MFENVESYNDIDKFFEQLSSLVKDYDPMSFYEYDHDYNFARIQKVGAVGVKITLAFPGSETTIVWKNTNKGMEVFVRGNILYHYNMHEISPETKFENLDEPLRTELWRTLCVLQDVINNSEVDI